MEKEIELIYILCYELRSFMFNTKNHKLIQIKLKSN